ncbi:glucose 1-dehydrogenase [Inquilinus limosus]|uniref:2-deoxy-D-gluconate 3-dehydrogenase n=1 Tax=Inquilinus limosus TaxID=171674 RepID=A0A211ZTM3_9PROT|nr:glucose 1-dehydrogenase [Inquilinus limosus]OWJ68603.1 2-deoxy-D-gluconate 3-dehydrogenase [Inquilinus limosus]
MFDLTGKIAIVTGGNGGIGLGIARGLARAGAALLLVGRDAAKTERAVAEIATLGAEASSAVADVTVEADCRAFAETALQRHGRIDILVNNAGTNWRKAPEAYSLEEWRALIDANLTSAFLATMAVFPAMRRQGAGKVVNIGSMTSIFGASFAAPYSASKGGVVQFTKACATAWAQHGIQVNAILPGWIDTELTQQGRVEVPGLNERVVARTPAGRWGVPDDLSGTAVYLSSRASDFVTGAAIPVDGGYSSQA